jgi:hypothetical protein
MPVRQLTEKDDLRVPRRISLSVDGLNNINNARHAGDLVENHPAARDGG